MRLAHNDPALQGDNLLVAARQQRRTLERLLESGSPHQPVRTRRGSDQRRRPGPDRAEEVSSDSTRGGRHGRSRRGAAAVVAALALTLAACAGTPEPREQMAVSQAAVERLGGSAGGEAPVEVATAREKLAAAQRALADKKPELARQLAEQAEADAVLAEARAREKRSTAALDEVREGLRALRAELARTPS